MNPPGRMQPGESWEKTKRVLIHLRIHSISLRLNFYLIINVVDLRV